MILFTSASPSPSRMQAQRDAIASWTAIGHTPVLIQSEDDDVSAYDDMGLLTHRTKRTTGASTGKNYVTLDGILEVAAKTSGNERVGIINADCRIVCERDHIERIADPKALSIFSRTDTDADGSTPEVFPWGFDLFVFVPDLLAPLVPFSPLALGLPWWDYLLPAIAINNKIPVMRHGNILQHVRHNDRYAYDSYLMQADAIERALGMPHNSRHTLLPLINANTTLVQ